MPIRKSNLSRDTRAARRIKLRRRKLREMMLLKQYASAVHRNLGVDYLSTNTTSSNPYPANIFNTESASMEYLSNLQQEIKILKNSTETYDHNKLTVKTEPQDINESQNIPSTTQLDNTNSNKECETTNENLKKQNCKKSTLDFESVTIKVEFDYSSEET